MVPVNAHVPVVAKAVTTKEPAAKAAVPDTAMLFANVTVPLKVGDARGASKASAAIARPLSTETAESA
jgi:hypothetical protein